MCKNKKNKAFFFSLWWNSYLDGYKEWKEGGSYSRNNAACRPRLSAADAKKGSVKHWIFDGTTPTIWDSVISYKIEMLNDSTGGDRGEGKKGP